MRGTENYWDFDLISKRNSVSKKKGKYKQSDASRRADAQADSAVVGSNSTTGESSRVSFEFFISKGLRNSTVEYWVQCNTQVHWAWKNQFQTSSDRVEENMSVLAGRDRNWRYWFLNLWNCTWRIIGDRKKNNVQTPARIIYFYDGR